MNDFSKATDELNTAMTEKGYLYFNVRNGSAGTNLKEGLASYFYNANLDNNNPAFPIYATSVIEATSPDMPYSLATFTIVEDVPQSLRIDAMNISMYECYDGGLRTSLDIAIKTTNDIPSRHNAAKQIEERWQKQYTENQKKWKQNSQKLIPKGKRIK